MLARRRGAVNLGAGGLRKLDGRDSDAAGSGVNEDPLTGAQRSVTVQAGPRGRIVDRDRGALLETHRVGQRYRICRCDVDDFGVTAETCSRQNSFADTTGIHPVTDGGHRAGDFVTDDRRELRRVRIEAHAGEVVGEVDSGGPNLDPQLARARWRRVRPLLNLQHRWVSVLGDDDCAQGISFRNLGESDQPVPRWHRLSGAGHGLLGHSSSSAVSGSAASLVRQTFSNGCNQSPSSANGSAVRR